MDAKTITSLLRQQRASLEELRVTQLFLIGPAAHGEHQTGETIDFLLAVAPPFSYQQLQAARGFLSGLLGEPVDLTLADPRDPAVAPFIDPLAVDVFGASA
jgi:predicted nucleotidyltransferase